MPATPSAKPEATETPLEALASICTVIAMLLFVQAFIFQNFEIPSASMQNTLLIGDHVVVDRTTFAPATKWAPFVHYRPVRRGDVIVFYKPNPETPELILVKRCIGIPGDRIHLRNGVVYLNDVAQNEPQARMPQDDSDPEDRFDPVRDNFPANGPPPSLFTTETWTQELPSHIVGDDLVVPPGKVFAMGDNRTHSADGRYWGFVPQENIMGRPLFVYWSFKTPQIRRTRPASASAPPSSPTSSPISSTAPAGPAPSTSSANPVAFLVFHSAGERRNLQLLLPFLLFFRYRRQSALQPRVN